MLTRKALADAIDSLDDDIKVLQNTKAETYTAYREQMKGQGIHKDNVKLELEAVKVAIRQRRAILNDATGVEERDSLTDEILTEIRTGTPDALARAGAREDRLSA